MSVRPPTVSTVRRVTRARASPGDAFLALIRGLQKSQCAGMRTKHQDCPGWYRLSLRRWA